MKRLIVLLLAVSISFSCKEDKKEIDYPSSTRITVKDWFAAWELLSEEVFFLESYQPVDFVFFDEEAVYSTSRTTVPEGHKMDGPSIFTDSLEWRYKKHKGQITLPSGETIPLGIMSFAAPLENQKRKTFFIMPLPSFWKSSGVESGVLSYSSFLTGIFVHEFSHTQQMATFGRKVSELEADNDFAFPLTDNIVQDYFGKDSLYIQDFETEVSAVYNSLHRGEEVVPGDASDVIELIQKRHSNYFTDSLNVLKPLDKMFLTMEGMGRFAMYEWLRHPKGGNLSIEKALKGTRRGKWSQDEGLGLAILYSRMVPTKEWGKKMFGEGSETLIDLLELEIDGEERPKN